MARHTFTFDGGEELTTMGAAWFVSYSYYNHINKEHRNWQTVSTASNRISVYRKTTDYHSYWLHKILEMNETNLNKNTIKLSGFEVKKMAEKILAKL